MIMMRKNTMGRKKARTRCTDKRMRRMKGLTMKKVNREQALADSLNKIYRWYINSRRICLRLPNSAHTMSLTNALLVRTVA
jgi:hypothetical protein